MTPLPTPPSDRQTALSAYRVAFDAAPGDQMTISSANFGAAAFVFGEGKNVRAVIAVKAEAV
jgi:hypothetical protein